MKCEDVRGLLPDRLDELLEPADEAALDEHVGACPACQAARRRAVTVREALYRPWAVPRAAPELATRIVRRHRRDATRRTWAILRYAAVFAAGVLVARTFAAPQPASTSPATAPAPVTAPAIESPFSDYPLRIR